MRPTIAIAVAASSVLVPPLCVVAGLATERMSRWTIPPAFAGGSFLLGWSAMGVTGWAQWWLGWWVLLGALIMNGERRGRVVPGAITLWFGWAGWVLGYLTTRTYDAWTVVPYGLQILPPAWTFPVAVSVAAAGFLIATRRGAVFETFAAATAPQYLGAVVAYAICRPQASP